jgi:adenylate kinase
MVHYELSREKAIERIMDRAKKEWRVDDNEESIKVRLAAFENETLPVINYFKEKWKVITIDADNQIDDIFNETIKLLD